VLLMRELMWHFFAAACMRWAAAASTSSSAAGDHDHIRNFECPTDASTYFYGEGRAPVTQCYCLTIIGTRSSTELAANRNRAAASCLFLRAFLSCKTEHLSTGHAFFVVGF
jgi:hypothetical protein